MLDDKVVVNPGAGPLGPEHRAALTYQEQRRAAPLPDEWSHGYGVVPWMGVGTEWHLVRPLHPVTCGLPSLVICHAESPEYVVELLFLPYRADDGGPPGRPLTGGFQLEFIRKDFGTPTDLEAEAVARLFCGTAFGPVLTLGRDRYRVLDGDPADRPFPTVWLSDDPPDTASKPLVRVVHCVLREPPASAPAGNGEAEEDPWGFELPVVWKDNTRTALKYDLRRRLRRRLRTHRVVHDWLCGLRLLGERPGNLDPDERERLEQAVASTQQRYGAQRLESLAGLPPAGSCTATDWANRITHAIARAWGKVTTTRWMLRLVPERF